MFSLDSKPLPGKRATVAVLGSGPAGLMAAFAVAREGHGVTIFEKKRGPGHKFLIAGSSGLNITYDCAPEEFVRQYRGPAGTEERFARYLSEFSPAQWIEFIEGLGIGTFKGTSRRYFVEGMKASVLLRTWLEALERLDVKLEYGKECTGFERTQEGRVRLSFAGSRESAESVAEYADFDAACFCLGGASYEPRETPLRWPRFFIEKGLPFEKFESSNVGFQISWPEALLAEAEGKPIKNVVLTSPRGSRSGDLVITRYGIEGTPVYFAGEAGWVHLDLKPDLTAAQLRAKLKISRENLSPIRRVRRFLKLGEGALALLFHMTPAERLADLDLLIEDLKRYPLLLQARQPLSEAISSSGGLDWAALTPTLMLREYPGIFVAGEMLNWDAPTGGFLIQACVSQGRYAGNRLVEWLAARQGQGIECKLPPLPVDPESSDQSFRR